MPLSIVFELSSQTKIPAGNLARQAQAWFLEQVSRFISPDLATRIHDEGELRPYTVSDLYDRVAYSSSFGHTKDWYRTLLRITSLEDNLAESLYRLFRRNMPRTVDIWWLNLKIDRISMSRSEHKDSGDASYYDLCTNMNQAISRNVWLNFVSPTTFRSEGTDLPFPSPSMVYRSCWRKWNAFSGIPINDGWLSVIDNCIQVTNMKNVNTHDWVFAEGAKGKATGFIGQIENSLNETACENFGVSPADALAVFHTLSSYLFYSGTGRKTSWGMGQVRPMGKIEDKGRRANNGNGKTSVKTAA
jgi:CRISPR-associated endoribonuclease Cas6